jgi:polyisoprenoid-binding protein YceI
MLMRKFWIFMFFLSLGQVSYGQRYMTQSGLITFFSKAPLENIEAFNNQVSSAINTANGEMAFSLLMKGFRFEKALMQEHFNEKYAESEKFPKASFKGKIEDFSMDKLGQETQKVKVKGVLTIKGISQPVEALGELRKVNNHQLEAKAVFPLALSDFGIKIPMAVKDNISNTLEISVKMLYDKLD